MRPTTLNKKGDSIEIAVLYPSARLDAFFFEHIKWCYFGSTTEVQELRNLAPSEAWSNCSELGL